jgi:hypothetical protein
MTMPEITPEPVPEADPSLPGWTPPDGNTIIIPTSPIPSDGEVADG